MYYALLLCPKILPVLHHSADYIFCFFGITELVLVCFEYTILLKPVLGVVRDVALFSISHEQTQQNRVWHILSVYDFLASKGSPFQNLFQNITNRN